MYYRLVYSLSFQVKKDCVICFHCGVQTGEWLDSDIPWVEHAKWSPTSLYVNHLKSLEFIQECQLLLFVEKNRCILID
jgi:hypothetical protein